jgi:nitronate monooxygenase
MIGSLFDMPDLRAQLTTASESLRSHLAFNNTTLPIGVGLLPFVQKQEDVIPILRDFKPRVVWLFAAKEFTDYAVWAAAIREASPETMIWIQCGSVSSALYLVKNVRPDAICIQGSDAGGHGFEKGAGIISLLPEAIDALGREGFGEIPLIAAGGIVNGRGVAAALALGASGVVMGTAFLGAEEAVLHPQYRAAVLKATDGSQSTIRSKLFDELSGPTMWPDVYDGRSLVMQSWRDFENAVPMEEIRRLHIEAGEEG